MNTAVIHPLQRRTVTLTIKTWVDMHPTSKVIELEGDASVYQAAKRQGADYLEEQFRLAEASNSEFRYAVDYTQVML